MDDLIEQNFLRVGEHFMFETVGGRVGIGVVLAIDFDNGSFGFKRPYYVEWYNDGGKHFEWFSLLEFINIDKMSKEQFVCSCKAVQ